MRNGLSTALVVAIAGSLAAGCSTAPRTSAPGRRTAPTTTLGIASAPTTNPGSPTITTVPATGRFLAESVTFVSPQEGWVLGMAACSAATCGPVILRTQNSGENWTPVGAPPIAGPVQGDQIRFANATDGWVYNDEGAGGLDLSETHDGGVDWHAVSVPGVSSLDSISDVEAADGWVFAAFNGSPVVIASSPVGTDDWTVSPTTLEIGGGPIPYEEIVLHGSFGWVAEVDRTVIAGASLASGSWEPWTPPCTKATGPMYLAASSADNLMAMCQEGAYGGPPAQTGLFVSDDGGASFGPSGNPLPENTFGPIATPAPGVVVMAVNGQGLLATFDGGAHWDTVFASAVVQGWAQIGFTSPTQGVAIGEGTMLMTFDGGHDWAPVVFPMIG